MTFLALIIWSEPNEKTICKQTHPLCDHEEHIFTHTYTTHLKHMILHPLFTSCIDWLVASFRRCCQTVRKVRNTICSGNMNIFQTNLVTFVTDYVEETTGKLKKIIRNNTKRHIRHPRCFWWWWKRVSSLRFSHLGVKVKGH